MLRIPYGDGIFYGISENLGLTLEKAKSAICTHNTFLGLPAHFPAPTNRMSLSLSLSPEKESLWASMSDKIVAGGCVSHATPESLIGRLGFAQTAVFGRFARDALKPLYAKLYAPRYSASITPAITRNLRWQGAALVNSLPRIITFKRSKPDWALYTDAAFDNGTGDARIAAIFLRAHANPPLLNAELALTGQPNEQELQFFPSTSTIFGLELLAIALSIYRLMATLRNRAAH